ncbi:MAG: permease-like cell division protein FtsX [Actinomycetota bacterium]|nr:permease-like cell division protein FtsX [Actinomycetota bacterium]
MKISAGYFTREAFSSFKKNIVQSIAAVTTVALCLVIVGIILLVMFVGGQVIRKIEDKVEIEIFMEGLDGPAQAATAGANPVNRWNQMEQLGNTIRSWPEVHKVDYISKEEALRKFKKDFSNSPLVVQQIEGNPLPASYRVGLNNPREVETIAKRIKDLPYIKELTLNPDENVKFGQDTVRKLFQVTRWISLAAVGFATLLIFVSLVLITNTIRLAIFARRKEIGIMRLVGASSWFIRWPFILEGMLEGLSGAVVAIFVLTSLWRTFFANLATGKVFAFLSFNFDQVTFVKLLLLLALSGAAIGAAGSFIALRRFLKI